MSFLASIIGSGAGIVVMFLAWLLGRHYHRLPGFAHPWAERLMIILMYAGGAAVAVTQVGQWLDDAVRFAAGWLGGLNAGLPHTALVVACMILIVAVVVAVLFEPSVAVGFTAAVLPLVLALVSSGFIHRFDVVTTAPAQALASSLSTWIGG